MSNVPQETQNSYRIYTKFLSKCICFSVVLLSYYLSSSIDRISYDKHLLFTDCNSKCVCSSSDWDPVCGENGVTYVSPCLAGCTTSAGSGKNTVSLQAAQNVNTVQPESVGNYEAKNFVSVSTVLKLGVVLHPNCATLAGSEKHAFF